MPVRTNLKIANHIGKNTAALTDNGTQNNEHNNHQGNGHNTVGLAQEGLTGMASTDIGILNIMIGK